MKRRLVFAGSAVLVFAYIGGYTVGRKVLLDQTSNAGISIDETSLGEIWLGEQVTHTFAVENKLSSPVTVSSFEASLRGSRVEPAALSLAPGERRNVSLVFSLPCPKEVRLVDEVKVHLKPNVVGASLARGWMFRGTAISPLLATPSMLSFKGVTLGQRPKKTCDVSFLAAPTGLTATSDKAKVNLWPLSGNEVRLEVSPLDSLGVGDHQFEIFLSFAMAGRTVACPAISVSVAVGDAVVATPASVSFGATPVGEIRVETITLTAQDGERFAVAAFSTSSASATLRSLGREEDRANVHRFQLSQIVESSGRQSQELKFAVVDGLSPSPRALIVPVEYYGIPSLIDQSNGTAEANIPSGKESRNEAKGL